MKADAIADALVSHGLDPQERMAKEALFARVLDAHEVLRGGPPAYAWWVPGRLEVFGKHTDYAGGRTLICAVPRGFAVAASARTDGLVQVTDANRGEGVTLSPSGAQQFEQGWRHYAEVTAHRLARNFPGVALGADVVVASDLPRASGMSSSSALVIAIATALARVGGVYSRSEWKTNIRNTLDEAGYYACIENGRSFAGLTGDAGVGTHGGSEDHAAIVEGRPGHVLAFAFVPARALGIAAVPPDWRFVLATCGIRARKTGAAQASYNDLSAAADALVALWNRHSGTRPAVSLGAALSSSPHAPDRLRAVAGSLRARLEHFIREDARVLIALGAFTREDAPLLGRLSEESQADAETLLANQTPETSALARSAREQGALAACSFGAGFGGAVWALVKASDAAAFAKRWHPEAFVARPGPPLTSL
jgi:galactokinase